MPAFWRKHNCDGSQSEQLRTAANLHIMIALKTKQNNLSISNG